MGRSVAPEAESGPGWPDAWKAPDCSPELSDLFADVGQLDQEVKDEDPGKDPSQNENGDEVLENDSVGSHSLPPPLWSAPGCRCGRGCRSQVG